jgi:hypothetical protein
MIIDWKNKPTFEAYPDDEVVWIVDSTELTASGWHVHLRNYKKYGHVYLSQGGDYWPISSNSYDEQDYTVYRDPRDKHEKRLAALDYAGAVDLLEGCLEVKGATGTKVDEYLWESDRYRVEISAEASYDEQDYTVYQDPRDNYEKGLAALDKAMEEDVVTELSQLKAKVGKLEEALNTISDLANRGTSEFDGDGYVLACDILSVACEVLERKS